MFQKIKRFFTYFRVIGPYLDDVVLWLSLVKDFPGCGSSVALRAWVKKVVINAQVIAGATSITLDDQALDILYKIVNNDDTWDILYSLIRMMTGEEKQCGACGAMEQLQLLTEKTEAMVVKESDEKVENPAILILSIVGFVLQVITFIRQREKSL